MSMTVKGVYRNGRIVLLETPKGVEEVEVVVTFPGTAISPADATAREARRQLALKWLTPNVSDGSSSRRGLAKPSSRTAIEVFV